MTFDRNNSVISAIPNVNVIPAVVDYNISQITPYVFVTAKVTVQQFPAIFSNHIGCVINVANELPHIVFPPQSGIESLKYPIEDNPTFPAVHYFDIIADRIAANVASNRRTLLYCHHGRSRSITFVLAYLIKHHHLPLPTAYALVKEKRQLALPNTGFWSQLSSYELYQQQRKQNASAPLRNPQNAPAPLRDPQNASAPLRDPRNPFIYGQQVINKISDGFARALANVPIINTLTIRMHPIYSKPNLHPYHHYIRRRPPIYANPYHLRIPSNINHRLFF